MMGNDGKILCRGFRIVRDDEAAFWGCRSQAVPDDWCLAVNRTPEERAAGGEPWGLDEAAALRLFDCHGRLWEAGEISFEAPLYRNLDVTRAVVRVYFSNLPGVKILAAATLPEERRLEGLFENYSCSLPRGGEFLGYDIFNFSPDDGSPRCSFRCNGLNGGAANCRGLLESREEAVESARRFEAGQLGEPGIWAVLALYSYPPVHRKAF